MSSASNGNGVPDAVPDGTRIGAQLKAARLAARMSMAEVAEQAGLTKGFVSKLERDLANVSVASLIRLCDALGVSVGSLFQAPTGEVIRTGGQETPCPAPAAAARRPAGPPSARSCGPPGSQPG